MAKDHEGQFDNDQNNVTISKTEYDLLLQRVQDSYRVKAKLDFAQSIIEQIADTVPRDSLMDDKAFSSHGHALAVAMAHGWVRVVHRVGERQQSLPFESHAERTDTVPR